MNAESLRQFKDDLQAALDTEQRTLVCNGAEVTVDAALIEATERELGRK